jgi:Tfp pilus assembly protein FimT
MPRPTRATSRSGSTLLELAVVMAMLAVLVLVAVPTMRRAGDAARVRAAVTSATTTLAVARHVAVARGATSTLRLDTARARLVVLVAAETVLVRDLQRTHGVRLAATRIEMRYLANGVGYGASNGRLAIGRGRSADTIIVSRLGRVRH